MGYIKNLGFIYFLFSLGLNLVYIDYSFAKFEVYTCNICDVVTIPMLFFVIQQAEVLLKFFGCVYFFDLVRLVLEILRCVIVTIIDDEEINKCQ